VPCDLSYATCGGRLLHCPSRLVIPAVYDSNDWVRLGAVHKYPSDSGVRHQVRRAMVAAAEAFQRPHLGQLTIVASNDISEVRPRLVIVLPYKQ
jgi:hypothetical protein